MPRTAAFLINHADLRSNNLLVRAIDRTLWFFVVLAAAAAMVNAHW
jgi:hypothetical protein